MDYQSLINDYLDGVISPENENLLFGELSYNKALRKDLRQFLDIEIAIDNAPDRSYVSSAVTGNIFAGLNIPQEEIPLPNKGQSIFRKYMQGFISSMATAVILCGIYFMFLNDKDVIPTVSQPEVNIAGRGASYSSDSDKPFDNVQSNSALYSKKNFGYIKKRIVHSSGESKIERKETYSSIQQAETKKTDLGNFFDEIQIVYSEPDLSIPQNIYSRNTFIPAVNQLVPDNNEPDSFNNRYDKFLPGDLSLVVSGSIYRTFPAAAVDKSFRGDFDNTALALQYSLSDDLQLGLECRNENFYLDYEGIINGQQYILRQNTNYLAFGAYMKYNYFDYKRLSGFIRGDAAFNRLGPVGRMSLGFEYTPNEYYSFLLGLEGSMLLYRQDNNDFYSKKLGFIYGVSLRF